MICLKKTRFALLIIALLTCSATVEPAISAPLPEGAELVGRHNGVGYQPFEVDGARLVPRVEFLQPGRDWERMDVYIPASAKPGDRLPCIVNVYGGGYAAKGVATIRGITQPLIERGYVVATPDYALQAQDAEIIAAWDTANAIRHLRANAERYQIDPERIGVVGWSAGGWIAQHLGYADPQSIFGLHLPNDAGGRRSGRAAQPMLEPRPLHADHPSKPQAVVSDWGAGKLRVGNPHKGYQPHPMLSPDDPPLLTCFTGEPRKIPGSSLQFLHQRGVPAEGVFLGDRRGTHVPPLDTPGRDASGNPTTWQRGILDYFDRTVKQPRRSSPPQVAPLIGDRPGDETTRVALLSVHRLYGAKDGRVYYTLDGSEPTEASPTYDQPVALDPGQTIRAIAVKPGLPPSAVASYTAPTLPRPVITTPQRTFEARVGEPFRVRFDAEMPHELKAGVGPKWVLSGVTGRVYKVGGNKPGRIPWLTLDPQTGELSGVPQAPGVYPVIVGVFVTSDPRGSLSADQTAADARLVVVAVNSSES